jgi:hypothetical protein
VEDDDRKQWPAASGQRALVKEKKDRIVFSLKRAQCRCVWPSGPGGYGWRVQQARVRKTIRFWQKHSKLRFFGTS